MIEFINKAKQYITIDFIDYQDEDIYSCTDINPLLLQKEKSI